MTITRKDVAEHFVNQGAALLDRLVPDWTSRITSPLDIGSPQTCVIAQTLGHEGGELSPNYPKGMQRLRALLADSSIPYLSTLPYAHGFISTWVSADSEIMMLSDLDMSEGDDEWFIDSVMLTEVWTLAIADRVAVAAS
jgi:hypothetical protein